jgi:uncharacterized protein with PIN domain
MPGASFRFHPGLNYFLPPERREKTFLCQYAHAATTKHMIEALGVPHTEIGRIVVNGMETGFDRLLQENDEVEIYPVEDHLSFPTSPASSTSSIRFIADAHLGGLARLLRMAGFDTLYDNHYDDSDIEAVALAENRVVLTRDLELLKRKQVKHGAYVRNLKPDEQLREVFSRFGLTQTMKPFSLCLHCNFPLHAVNTASVPVTAAAGYSGQAATGNICVRCWVVCRMGAEPQIPSPTERGRELYRLRSRRKVPPRRTSRC